MLRISHPSVRDGAGVSSLLDVEVVWMLLLGSMK